MSQVAPKSQRPTLSLNAQLVGNVKNKPRSNTPSEKSDSRSSTPAQQLLETSDGQSASPKGKRRISNDSPKIRASPKSSPVVVVVIDDIEKEKNGQTNGSNGAHVEGNGVAEKKEVTPKNAKKEKETEKANGKKEKELKEETTVKATPEKKQKKQENALVLGEKTQPEMEKLVLEPDTPADSPMPKSIGKSPAATRILKYTPGKGRISPFKTATERLQNASTCVNLSTVSEQSSESTSAANSPVVVFDSPVKPPTGRVTGRRNTRPIKEIKMLHPTINANDSTSSMTANLGSPVHNDSLRTPIISQLIGRKRAGTPDHDDIHVDSPSKRARIDFSGFLGYVTTPITNLKNRLSRIGLSSSTPRALEMEENIADVSAMETEQEVVDVDAKDVSKAVEASDSVIEKEIEDIKADNAEKQTENTDIETSDPPTPPRRRSVCNIM